jgi:hypothetical protein
VGFEVAAGAYDRFMGMHLEPDAFGDQQVDVAEQR